MKPKSYLTTRVVGAAALVAACFTGQGYGQTEWTAGSGTDMFWSTTGNWSLGTPNLTDDVVFGSPIPNPGALLNPWQITVGGGSVARSINFQDNYSLLGGMLQVDTGLLRTALGTTSRITSELVSVNGLTKVGGGALFLDNAANAYTGVTTISNGSLIISSPTALGTDPSAVIVSGFAGRGFGGGALVLDGLNGAMNFSRDLVLQGLGPIADRSAALMSVGNNELSGAVSMSGGLTSTRMTAVNSTLTLSGSLDVGGTAGTTISGLGSAANAAGASNYLLTGALTGTGTLEKTGAGTLWLMPSDTTGFSGIVRVGQSATGTTSSVRITTPNVLGTRTTNGTGGVFDLNTGTLEVRMDTPSLLAGGLAANVYQRNNATIFVDHSPGGSAVNGTAAFGQLAYEDNFTLTMNSRNGYGASFTSAPVVGTTAGDNNSAIANNMGGLLSFVGNFWSNANNTANRTMTLSGNGNTLINGNIVASAAAFDHNLTKSGSGQLTITGTGSTLDGSVNIQGGTVAITDFRSINNNTSAINIGSSTTGAILTIGTSTAATQAGLTTSRVVNLAGTTGGATINASQAQVFPVTFNANFTATGAGAKTLTLTGTNTSDNVINGVIPNSTSNTALAKAGPGTWVLAGANTYSGTTTLANGVLKVRANGAISTVLPSANNVTFGQINTFAGATFEFVGQSGVNNVQSLGTLAYSNGANTVKLTPGAGGTASLVFNNLTTGGAATVNFVGGDAVNNTITINQINALPGADGIITRSVFWNGADYAFRQAGVLRAPVYGVDTGTATTAVGPLTSGVNNEVTGSFSLNSISVPTLKIAGSQVLTINAGQTLTLSGSGVLGTGGISTVTGGTLATGAQPLVARVNQATDSLTINSVVTGTGGLTKVGAGTLVFGGVNTRTGTTSIEEGTVRLAPGAVLSGASAALTIRQLGRLDLNGANTGNSIGNFNSVGVITNSSVGNATLVVGNGNGTGTSYGGIEDGAGRMNLTKVGTGAQSWLGQYTYSGVTTIGSTGLISVNTLANIGQPSGIGRGDATSDATNAASLVFNGSTAGLVYVGNVTNSSLILTSGSTSATTNRLFTLAGTGATLSSTVSNNNSIVWSNTGAIVHGVVGPQTLTLTGTSAGDNQFFPQLSDSGTAANVTSVLKTGTGVWWLGNTANTYSGPTTVQGGILVAMDGTSLPTASNLVLDGGVFQTNGAFNRTIGTGAGQMRFTPSTATTGKFSGGFSAQNSKLTLNWGTGNVWGGTAGFLDTRNGLILSSTAALDEVEIASGFSLGAASGAGLGPALSFTIAQNSANVTVASTAGLIVGQAVRGTNIPAGAYIVSINSATQFSISANTANSSGIAGTYTDGEVIANNLRTIRVDDNASTAMDFATLSGVISGEAGTGIRKVGGGILRMLGENTYSGETNVYQGTLVVNSLGNSANPGLGTSVGISTDANLAAGAITLGNGVTGASILQYTGPGEVSDRMIRLNSTTGANQIHADGVGPLILTNIDNTQAAGNKVLNLRGSNTQGNMITSQLSDFGGTLGITVDGGATWILNNPLNDYTGVTSVNAGALGIGDNAALGAGTGNLALNNGSVFAFGGDRTVPNPLSLANNTTVAFFGDHSLSFTNTFSLLASANNVGITNTIAAGKSLTLGAVTANAMTGTRAWTINGSGDTTITGDITTSTNFNLNLTYSGTGSLTLAGTNSNFNGGVLTVSNGTLRLGADEVIPHGFSGPSPTVAAPVTASTTITVADTSGLVVGQPFTGLGVTAGATIASITNGTTFVASAAQTLPAGTSLYFNPKGNVVLNPAVGFTARFDVNGRTETINGLTANTAGIAVIDNSSATAGSLSFGANDQAVAFTGEVRNSGAGALSITKIGAASAVFAQGPFEHTGSTIVNQGSLSLGGDVTATSALLVGNGASLSISGALNGGNVTNVSVGDGGILSLLNGAGSQLTGLTDLTLGSMGGTLTTLNLNVGDLNATGDGLNTDTLGLLAGGDLNLFAGNQILFNLADAGLNGNTTYTLLQVADGGLSALGLGNFLQGATPGGFDGFTWQVTDNFVRLQTGNLLTGNVFWTGTTDSTWNGTPNNWATDKAGTVPAVSIPGAGQDVVFAANSIVGTPITTTLEQRFRVNSLTFEPSTNTPSAVTIGTGADAAALLDVKPSTSDKGITMAAGGPAGVTINSGVKLGADQTWNVADAATLTSPSYATASTNVTVASTAGLVPGMVVAGPGIPAGTTIASITDGTSFVLSAPTTAASTTVSLTATSVLTVGGALSGSGVLTKTGAGRVVLGATADPTFATTSIQVNGGALQINNTTALGSTVLGNAATVQVNSGGTFYYNGAAATVSNPITLNGGTLSAAGGNQTYNGAVSIPTDSFVQMLDPVTNAAGRNITLSGVVTGAGRLTVDSVTTLSSGNPLTGTLTFSQNNSGWTGGLNILRGTAATTNVNGLGTGPINISLGRVAWQGPSGATWAVPNAITIADPSANALAEINVDATGTVTSPFTANFNGLVTLGNSATTGEMRIFLADGANTVANFNGGILLENNGIINARDSATSPVNLNSVISEVGGPRNLAINTLGASGWGGTGGLVTLNAANTFSGSLTIGAGVVQFSTVSNIGGPASNLGMGSDILMGGGTLRFIGSSNQATDRPIATTGSVTLQVSGTGGAAMTFNGGITQNLNNALNLGGTGVGVIRGGVSQLTGSTADVNVQGGTWTFENIPLVLANHVIMNGASTLTLASTGIIVNNGVGTTDNRVYVRGDSVLNLAADNVLDANMRGVTLGDATNIGTGTMNMNGHSLAIRRLDLGGVADGFIGLIPGTGTINLPSGLSDYNDGLRLFRGSIAVNLAGTTTLLKQGLGDVTLSGDNSGLVGGLAQSRVDSGNLILDFSTNNGAKISQGANLRMLGGNLILQGGIVGPTSQSVLDLQLDGSGSNRITLHSGAFSTDFGFNGLTRVASQGTIRFELPAQGGITSTAINAAGLGMLGSFATVKDGAGTWFATVNGNSLEGLASVAKPDVSTWLAIDHVTDGASGFTGSYQGGTVLSLRMNGNAGSNLNLSPTAGLAITSGGILATSDVATGSLGIAGGFLSSGNNELVVTQDSALPMNISSWIGGSTALTKTGPGTLVLNGVNTFTGQTQLQAGTLVLAGGDALGDISLITMADDQFTTLRLLTSETIGRLQGGSATDGLRNIAVVDIGVNRLTLNTTGGNVTYSGQLVGSGQLVKQGTSNQAFNNISLGFTGTVVVNEGLFQMNGIGQMNASSIVINRTGNLLFDNNSTTRSGTRILDTTPIIMNSAAGTFSGETVVRGLAIRTDQNATTSETIGDLIFNSGTNYLTGQASGGTSAQAAVIANDFIRLNNATVAVRGRNLGATANERNQFRIGTAATQTAFLASPNLVGGAGPAGSPKLKVVPWAVGQTVNGGIGSNHMGNSLVTYVSGRGFVALDLTTEYAGFAAAAADDNVRESFFADVTGLTGKTVNALVLHQDSFSTSTLSVSGTGAGQQLVNTSGAFLFTIGDSTSATVTTNVGGFDDGIAVGGSEYVMHVVNPSSVANTSVNRVVLNSPLVSAADLTKSGRGTLTLTTPNIAGGGANKTTINEGILEITALNNIGGATGGLVFAGGTLRLATGFDPLVDDLSSRSMSFLIGGGTLDTSGIDLSFAGSLGAGEGGFTKTGLGVLTLNAAATYTGATAINGGSIVIGADNAIGSGNLSLAGGTALALGTNSVSVGQVSTAGASPAITGTGTLMAAGGFSFNHTGDTSIEAILAGPGGLVKAQSNVLSLTGDSTFTGRVEVRGGTLAFDSIGLIGGGGSALGAPATLLDGTIYTGLTTGATALTYTGSGHLSDRGIAMQGTTGGLTINAEGTGGVGFGAVTGLTSGAKTLTLAGVADAALVNSINGVIEGPAVLTLVKNGTSTWALAGASTHTGTTTVNAGVLNLRHGAALGATTQGTTVVSGATLQLEGGITVAEEALSVSGVGALGQSGALVNLSGVNVYGGPISLAAAATFGADAGTLELTGGVSGFGDDLTIGGAGELIFSGDLALSSGRLIQTGSGVTLLLGNNTMTGGVQINDGIVALGNQAAVGSVGDIVMGGGTLRFLAGGEADLSPRLLLGTGANYQIDTPASVEVTFGSALTGLGGLVKTGDGTLNLTAINSFEGPVTIAGGKLGLVDQSGLGFSPLVANPAQVTLDGGTLLANASFSLSDVNRGITLGAAGGTFEVVADETLTVATVLTGPGGFTKSGLGTLLFTAPAAYLGNTTIAGGTLALGVDDALPVTTNLTVGSGGGLDLGSFNLSVASFEVAGTGASISGTGAISSAAGFNLSPAGDAVIGSNLGGAGALTKTGAGSVTLTGNNTYTGGTTISEGALFVNGSLAAGLVDVQAGAVLGGTGGIAGDVTLMGTLAQPAVLRPGPAQISSGIDLLTIDGALTLGEYSMVEFYLSQTGFTQLAVGSIASIDATARFKFNLADGYIPAAGAFFPVLDWGTTPTPGGNRLGIADWIPYLILPDLGPEFVWAASDFGLLGIVAASGTAPALTFVDQPTAALVLEGEPVSFTVAVNGPEPILIQWYKAAAATGAGTIIPGANGLSYTISSTAGTDAGFYYAVATNSNNLTQTAESTRAELDVVTLPRIVTQPVGATVFPSTNVTFEVEAIGPGTLSYVWKRNGVAVNDAPNAAVYTITGVTAANAGSYTVEVSNANGTATSSAAVLNVLAPIVFDTQPQNVTTPEGNPATFSVAVSGDGPFTYQWRRNGVDLAGEEGDSLTVTAATNNSGAQGNYTVRVSNAYASLLSNVATLTLGPVQVVIDDQPLAQAVQSGSTLNLAVSSSGGKPQTFQWFFKGRAIVGATSETLSIPNVSLAQAGLYTCRVSNNLASGSSTVLSAAASVAVVDGTARRFVVNEPGTVSLSVTAAADRSDVLAYQWFLDDGVSTQQIAGATARTFRVTAISAGRKRYFCQVTAQGGNVNGGDNVVLVYNQAPAFVGSAWTLPATTVSEAYSFQLPMDGQTVDPQIGGVGAAVPERTPVSYRATGLPAGLTVNSLGVISGRATVDGTFTVTLTATNARGTTTPLVRTLVVAPLSNNVIGEFVGPVDRDPVLTSNLGGAISVRTTKKGTYTGRVTLGAKSYSFKGALNPLPGSAGASVVISRGKTLPPVTLTFALDATTGLINRSLSSISDGVNSVGFDGWRYVWTTLRGQPPAAAALAGYYTMALSLPSGSPLIGTTANEGIPQGIGFASFTVSPTTGRLSVVGRLADGTAFTTATYAGPGGEVMIFRTLYAANARGSVVGSVTIDDLGDSDPNNNTLAGSVNWWRPATPGTTARLYRAGFAPLDLDVAGSRYIAPVATSATPRVLALPATAVGTPNAVVELTQGLVEGQLPLFDVANPSLNEVSVRVDERNRALAIGTNPRKVTLTINAKTGAISGRFALEVFTPVRVVRTVSYSGMIVGDGVQPAQGQGYFLLPKLPATALERPTTTAILSGQVIFDSL
jgi:autotransporter-associated beta strand protein